MTEVHHAYETRDKAFAEMVAEKLADRLNAVDIKTVIPSEL